MTIKKIYLYIDKNKTYEWAYMVHDVFAVWNHRLNKILAHRFATRIASLCQFDRGHNKTDNFHKPNTTGCGYFFLKILCCTQWPSVRSESQGTHDHPDTHTPGII